MGTSSVWDNDGAGAGILVPDEGNGISSLATVGTGQSLINDVDPLTGAAKLKSITGGTAIQVIDEGTQLKINYTGENTVVVDNVSSSYNYIAAPGQDEFVVLDDITLSRVHVWLNGLKLTSVIDFSVDTLTKTIILSEPCDGNERVEVVVTGSLTISVDVFRPTWKYIDTSYTAAAYESLMVDTTGGAVSISLPASPALGDTVEIIDAAGNFHLAACSVLGNGALIMGVAAPKVLNSQNAAAKFVFATASYGWRVISDAFDNLDNLLLE